MSAQTRDASWADLHDPSTSSEVLAEIAAAHPEFAATIAVHPNAYPALQEWARAIAAPTEAAPGGIVRSLGQPLRFRGLWIAALAVFIAAPILQSLSLAFAGYAAYAWTGYFGFAAPIVFAVAAAVTAPSVGRKIGGSAIALVAIPALFLSYFLWFAGAAVIVALLFLSWAIARPLRGAGYAALPVAMVLAAVSSWASQLPYALAFNGDWQFVQFLVVIATAVLAAISAALTVWLAMTWSRISERRQAARIAHPATNRGFQGGYDVSTRTNTTAVLALVFGFFVSVAAVILGHVALSQIARTGEQGRGMAIAGLVLGYIGLVLGVGLLIWQLALFSSLSSLYGYGY